MCTTDHSIEYATRLAKVFARRMGQPVYVGCSVNVAGMTVEEEMEGLAKTVEEVMKAWNETSVPIP